MIAGTQPNTAHLTASFDGWRCGVVCLIVILCALAYSFQLLSFLHAKEAVLLVGLIVLSLLGLFDRCGRGAVIRGIAAYGPLWALLGWSLLFHIVFGGARVSAYAAQEVSRLSVLLLVAALAYPLAKDARWRGHVVDSMIVASSLVAGLGLIQYAGILPGWFPVFPEYDQQIYSVFGNQDLLGGFLAMGLSLAVHRFFDAHRPGPLVYIALLLLIVVLLLSSSRTAWLAALVGIAIVIPYRELDWKKTGSLASICVLLFSILCAIAPDNTYRRLARPFAQEDVGGRARLWFWDATARMIRDAPVTGHGLGNYAYWSPLYQGEALRAPGGETHYHNEIHTLHAHSDPLELAAETGIPGLLFVCWMLWRIRRGRGPEWGGLAALGVFALFNATYHSAAHALCGLLLAGNLLAGDRPPDPEVKHGASSAAATAFVALLLVGLTIFAVLIPSYRMGQVANAYREGRAVDRLYKMLTKYPWPNALAHEEWATMLEGAGRYSEAQHHVEEARKGRDTGSVRLLAGALAEREGNHAAAREAYEASLLRWPGHMGAWMRLMPLLSEEERANALKEASRWISPEQVESLR